ncbi:MAG TPA: cysteine--tRNA ligase [candidate division Zixibacteria bacterium]
MGLKVYNTLTRKREAFKPIVSGKVGLYTCGPTVYDFAHIGNFRAYVFGDLLRRYLEYKGYEVKQVMNITDIDDKTIKGSQEKGIPLTQYTMKFKKAFFEDMEALNIKKAHVYPEATSHLKEMIEFVKKLLDKGNAYRMDNSVYFKISSFPEYGKLSKMKLDELKTTERVLADEYEKEQIADFALWKGWEEIDGDVFWITDFGKGRPGWHLECSVMSMKYLGNTVDIHTGGVDLIFPHHENEIAQSESVTGKKFVNYWLHNEFLMVEGKRMAKSLGNYYTLRDLLAKGYNPKAIRYLLLSTHYRQQLNFTFEGLKSAEGALNRLFDFIHNLKNIKDGKNNPKIKKLIRETKKEFEEALDDDLNMSQALSKIFDLVKEVNLLIERNHISESDAKALISLLVEFDNVLGVLERVESIDEEMQGLIYQREEARRDENWELADKIRKQLEDKGIILEDTSQGTKWKKKL